MENIDIDTAYIVKKGTLKKTGEEYALTLLSAKNIDQILHLQDLAYFDLPEDQRSFLLRKDREFFEKHFEGNNPVIGIVHDNKLIAQSVIVHPTSGSPKTGMTDIRLKARAEKMTVLQGIVVHPEYRGNSLINVMINAWLDAARNEKRTHAMAEVALDNFFSWAAFLKQGLHIHSVGTDPADGTELYNIYRRIPASAKSKWKVKFTSLGGKFNLKAGSMTVARRHVACPKIDFDRQKELLAKGYKGVKFDPANDNIEFKLPLHRRLKKKPKTPKPPQP